jgi:predicted DNA-binding transcriptional regulator AlpA
MTATELLAMPTMLTLEEARRALRMSRSTAYAKIKYGTFPVPVVREGGYRVRQVDLLEYLGIPQSARLEVKNVDGEAV